MQLFPPFLRLEDAISQTWITKSLRGRHILVTWYSGSRGGPELRVPESLGTLVCRSRPEQLGAGVTRITGVPDSRVTPGCRCHRTSCVPKSLGEPWCPSHSELRRAGVTWTQLCRRHSEHWDIWVILNLGERRSLGTPGCRSPRNSVLSDSPDARYFPNTVGSVLWKLRGAEVTRNSRVTELPETTGARFTRTSRVKESHGTTRYLNHTEFRCAGLIQKTVMALSSGNRGCQSPGIFGIRRASNLGSQ
jgi:hypothetical protein